MKKWLAGLFLMFCIFTAFAEMAKTITQEQAIEIAKQELIDNQGLSPDWFGGEVFALYFMEDKWWFVSFHVMVAPGETMEPDDFFSVGVSTHGKVLYSAPGGPSSQAAITEEQAIEIAIQEITARGKPAEWFTTDSSLMSANFINDRWVVIFLPKPDPETKEIELHNSISVKIFNTGEVLQYSAERPIERLPEDALNKSKAISLAQDEMQRRGWGLDSYTYLITNYCGDECAEESLEEAFEMWGKFKKQGVDIKAFALELKEYKGWTISFFRGDHKSCSVFVYPHGEAKKDSCLMM